MNSHCSHILLRRPWKMGPIVRSILMTLLLSAASLAYARAGDTTRSMDAVAAPPPWAISASAVFTAEHAASTPEVDLLLAKLEKKGGEGAPMSRKEFAALLERPEAKEVYTSGILRYATPQSTDEQARVHTDFSKRLMSETSLRSCIDFMESHRTLLRRVEKKYTVKQQDIVGILTWESGLGKYTGKYRIFNVYLGQILFLDSAQKLAAARIVASGAPDPLADSLFERREMRRLERRKLDAVSGLASLLRLSKNMKFDPLAVRGSWGGAIGYVQFMPYNIKYAVDADSNGLDLATWPDAIFSVASFLKHQGRYKPTPEGRRRAMLCYNRSAEYADGVIALADTIGKLYQLPHRSAH